MATFAAMNNRKEKRINSIGVFCGSSAGGSAIYTEAATALGRLLVSNNITMVYGGGNIGLMGVIADAMLAAGGQVIGVIPGHLLEKELAHQEVNDMRIVDDMSTRKSLIYELSDAFVAMPGGFGTMDEIFEMLTQFQLGISDKPCGLLNTNNFYDLLAQQLDLFVKERFLRHEHREHLLINENPDLLLKMIQEAAKQGFNDQQWIEALKINNKY
jgi:uncharacterized protein (TIGR00730 family)